MITKHSSYIFITFQREGVHAFPRAGSDPRLATGSWDDVSFLQYPHRHIFHFTVKIQVEHNDREIEFIQFKRRCERLYSVDNCLDLDNKSCEMIAEELIDQISKWYPGREIEVIVSEDGENGSILNYVP